MPKAAPHRDPRDIKLRVALALLQEREYGELLAAVLDAAIEGLKAERGFVLVREDSHFRAAVARNYRSEALARAEESVSSSIARTALESRRAVLLGDAQSASSFRHQPSVQRLSLRSVLCAPLVASQEAFALIYLENRDVVECFTEEDRELLDEICALAAPRLRAAVAVEHARQRAQDLELSFGESDGIITAAPAMTEVLQTARRVAVTDLPILIQGETGTGKELIARAIYRHSKRARNAFVVLNCAAIPAALMESELFGYTRGAFTGAQQDRLGFVGAAHRGTLFLDEIGELPLDLQGKLLRVLQSGEFTRLGSTQNEVSDIRVVAATNRDLQREVDEHRFRMDLFYRLATITLKVPPLRERPDDVHLLAAHFLRQYAARFGRDDLQLGDDAVTALASYAWLGNVRELESEMARLAAICAGQVASARDLSDNVRNRKRSAPEAPVHVPPMPLAEMEKRLIVSVLEHTGGNRTRAAEVLGVSREGLRTKMQRFGLVATGEDN